MHLGDRLREERERLGFNQSDFAALAGSTRKTQFNYESGERSPDTKYLEAIADAGADVLYILTGARLLIEDEAHQAKRDVAPYGLKPDESALLAAYRRSTPAMQEAALRMLDAAVQPTGVMPEGLKMKKPGEWGIPAVMRSGTPVVARRSSRKKKGGD